MVENRRKCRRYRVATGRSGVELLAGRGNLFKRRLRAIYFAECWELTHETGDLDPFLNFVADSHTKFWVPSIYRLHVVGISQPTHPNAPLDNGHSEDAQP